MCELGDLCMCVCLCVCVCSYMVITLSCYIVLPIFAALLCIFLASFVVNYLAYEIICLSIAIGRQIL